MARFIPYQSGKAFFEPTRETFEALEEAVQWAENEVPSKIRRQMDLLVFYMALLNQGYARKMSFGPYDPVGHDTALAWRTPAQGIRRISERYYLGWKVRRLGPAAWQLYNDSREAYFIEFGIHNWNSPRRIRRPVRKLSLLKTIEFLQTTHVWHRTWVSMYRHEGKGQGFTQIIQSPGVDAAGGLERMLGQAQRRLV